MRASSHPISLSACAPPRPLGPVRPRSTLFARYLVLALSLAPMWGVGALFDLLFLAPRPSPGCVNETEGWAAVVGSAHRLAGAAVGGVGQGVPPARLPEAVPCRQPAVTERGDWGRNAIMSRAEEGKTLAGAQADGQPGLPGFARRAGTCAPSTVQPRLVSYENDWNKLARKNICAYTTTLLLSVQLIAYLVEAQPQTSFLPCDIPGPAYRPKCPHVRGSTTPNSSGPCLPCMVATSGNNSMNNRNTLSFASSPSSYRRGECY
jgi:hypothetical protein